MADGIVLWGGGTPRTLRPHWMLSELDVPYEARPIGPRTGETQTAAYRAVNAKQKVPALQDGDFILTESAAIVTYLADTYGQAKGLTLPSDPKDRARYDEWCFFLMTELDATSLYIVRRHGDLSDIYGKAPAAVASSKVYAKKYLDIADDLLKAAGAYALGSKFSAADILLTTCLDWAIGIEIPIGDTLSEYRQRLHSRDAYQEAARINYDRS